jgi:hypothetical protein
VLELLVLLVVLLLLGVVAVEELLVLEELVAVELVGVVGVVTGGFAQSWAATCVRVVAPWLRFVINAELTDGGRFAIALANPDTAFPAAPHWRAATAEETESSWLLSVFA